MWWWRRLVVLGLQEVSDRQAETATLTPVEGDAADEYFLLY